MARRRREVGSELNQRIVATTKILPENYNWLITVDWLKDLSVSKILDVMVEYAKLNEEDFKIFSQKWIETKTK